MKSFGKKFLNFFWKHYDILLIAIVWLVFIDGVLNLPEVEASSSQTQSDVPSVYSQSIKDDLEKKRIRYITKTVINLLNERHYRPQLLNEDLSEKDFVEYLKLLDPNKMYFTQKDIENFWHYGGCAYGVAYAPAVCL